MFSRLESIKYQVIEQILLFKRKSIIYIFSLYVALILPAIMINSIVGVAEDRKHYVFDNIENAIVATWDNSDIKIPEYDKFTNSRTICSYNDKIYLNENDSKNLNIIGVDRNYSMKKSLPVIKGKIFSLNNHIRSEKVCIVHENIYNNLKKKEYIRIGNTEYKVIGIMKDRHYDHSIYIPFESIVKNTSRIYSYRSIVFSSGEKNLDELSENVKKEISSKFKSVDDINIDNGRTLKDSYIKETNKWIYQRLVVVILSIVFFLINQSIITYQQLKSNKKSIALKMTMGVTSLDLVICSLVESLVLSFVANLFLILTIKRIGVILNDYLRIDISFVVVMWVAIVSMIVCILMNIIVVKYLNKLEINRILVSEEE